MAKIRLEAFLDLIPNMSKSAAMRARKELEAVFEQGGPILRSLDAEIKRIEQQIEKTAIAANKKVLNARKAALSGQLSDKKADQTVESIRREEQRSTQALRAQQSILKDYTQIQRTRFDVTKKELREGEKIANQLRERKALYRNLSDAQKAAVNQYRVAEEGRLKQLQSTLRRAESLGSQSGNLPHILTAPRLQAESLANDIRELKNLTDARKIEAAAIRDSAKATRERTKLEREAARERTKLERDQIKKRRAREGDRLLEAAGGVKAIGAIGVEDLPLVREGLKRRIDTLNRVQDRMLRQGNELTPLFERNKQAILDYGQALQRATGRVRGFNNAAHETALFIRQFIRLGLGFSAVFTVIDGIRATVSAMIDLNKQMVSIQAVA